MVTGTTISSTTNNNTLSDIASNGLTLCVLKDGSQTITADIPMSSFKLTGLAAGSTAGDSVRYQQVLLLAGGTMTGNLLFTDATYDIGASGATRPRDIFLSRNAVIGGTLNVTGHPTLEGVTATGATGTNLMVFATSPTLTTPVLGTPSSGTLSSCTTATQSAGTNNTTLASTGYADRIGITAGSVLSQNPYATSATVTQAHGLGAEPTFVKIILECINAEHNYSTGDRIVFTGFGTSFNDSQGLTVLVDSTNVIMITATGLPYVLNKTTFTGAAITAVNWKVFITPYRVGP